MQGEDVAVRLCAHARNAARVREQADLAKVGTIAQRCSNLRNSRFVGLWTWLSSSPWLRPPRRCSSQCRRCPLVWNTSSSPHNLPLWSHLLGNNFDNLIIYVKTFCWNNSNFYIHVDWSFKFFLKGDWCFFSASPEDSFQRQFVHQYPYLQPPLFLHLIDVL